MMVFEPELGNNSVVFAVLRFQIAIFDRSRLLLDSLDVIQSETECEPHPSSPSKCLEKLSDTIIS